MPRDNKAISLWANERAAFDHVVTEIAKVVDDLRSDRTAEPELVEQASPVAVVASAPSPPHLDPLPRAGEGDLAEAAGIPRPPAEGILPRWPEPLTRASRPLSRRERDGVRADPRELPDLAVFKDLAAPWCPEMVVIPAGQFLMGSPPDEPERFDAKGPQHRVTIGYRFALGRYVVSVSEYAKFAEATSRSHEGGMYICLRVSRGGSWVDDPRICRSADRDGAGPVIGAAIVASGLPGRFIRTSLRIREAGAATQD